MHSQMQHVLNRARGDGSVQRGEHKVACVGGADSCDCCLGVANFPNHNYIRRLPQDAPQQLGKVDPDFGNPYNDIGAYLIEKGRFEEALEWLNKATKAPRYESTCYAHYNLGKVYEHQGNWFRAIQSYEESLKDNSQYTLAQKALKRVQAKLN